MSAVRAPRDTTMAQIARDQRPVTEKQRAYIESLLEQKDVTGTAYEGWEPDWSQATSKKASAVIEFLMARPNKTQPKREFGASWASIPVGKRGYGYYALEVNEGQHKFFRIERPKDGPHAGKTFIKEQASDAFYPIEPRARGFAYMTQIANDPETAAMAYATLLEKCYRCGRTLTDADSRARGIGPDCAKQG